MSEDLDPKQQELRKIQDDLKATGLSRRNFINRLSAVGVGFGAAFTLGIRQGDAKAIADAGVNVASTNPAVDNILAERQADQADAIDPDEPMQHLAQYGRFYRRGYRRFYGRYGRFYPRFYGRYARFYRRFYRRFWRRF